MDRHTSRCDITEILLKLCQTPFNQSDSSILKAFAEDTFEFEEKGQKISNRVDNTVEKGEVAHYLLQKLYSFATKLLFCKTKHSLHEVITLSKVHPIHL